MARVGELRDYGAENIAVECTTYILLDRVRFGSSSAARKPTGIPAMEFNVNTSPQGTHDLHE